MTPDEERLTRIAIIIYNSVGALNAALEMGAVVGLQMRMKREILTDHTVPGRGTVVYPRFTIIIENDPGQGQEEQGGNDNQD